MKKIYNIIFITILIVFFTGCKSVDYKEMYLNEEIQIKQELEVVEVEQQVEQVLEKFYNLNKVEIRQSTNKDGISMNTLLMYDKEKEIILYEMTYINENKTIENYTLCNYVKDGYMYEYLKDNDEEVKQKYKLFIEDNTFDRVLHSFLPYMLSEIIFQEQMKQYGTYNYGIDNYKNLVLLFDETNELPVMSRCCHALVIEDEKPVLYVYEYLDITEIYEFNYKNIKIKMPNLDDYIDIN